MAVAYVIKQLVACSKLKFLSIAMNSIGDASCDSLTKFCTKNRSLESLNCNWGYIRCKSAEEVANSLRWVSTLTHLDLVQRGRGRAEKELRFCRVGTGLAIHCLAMLSVRNFGGKPVRSAS